jgi:ABC-type Fe3+ transport system permease subunit
MISHYLSEATLALLYFPFETSKYIGMVAQAEVTVQADEPEAKARVPRPYGALAMAACIVLCFITFVAVLYAFFVLNNAKGRAFRGAMNQDS